MDGGGFDDLARQWTRAGRSGVGRRRLLVGLAGTALGALGLLAPRRPAAAQTEGGFDGLPCAGPSNLPCPPGYGCAAPRMVGAYGRCFALDSAGAGAGPEPATDPAADPCAAVRCAAGYRCCNDCGRAVCLVPGVACPDRPCGPDAAPPPAPPRDPCAAVTCPAGSTCCSQCDGVCAPEGVSCADLECRWQSCGNGDVLCGPGEFCCNESCGICAPLGGACTLQVCG